MESARNAVVILPRLIVPARLAVLGKISDETAYEKIKSAIVVVVEPNRTGGPARDIDSGFLRHIAEGTVAVVAVQ